MKPEYEDHRHEFLMEMYKVYWANMARAMEGVWKILAPITVTGTLMVAVHRDYLPASLGITLAYLVILWALNMTIDLNSWHRRNLLFLAKAEQEFLRPDDYGKLLPAEYRQPSIRWITFYKINALVFVTFLAACATYSAVSKRGLTWEVVVPSVVLLLGAVATYVNHRAQEESAKCHKCEMFGRIREDPPH